MSSQDEFSKIMDEPSYESTDPRAQSMQPFALENEFKDVMQMFGGSSH